MNRRSFLPLLSLFGLPFLSRTTQAQTSLPLVYKALLTQDGGNAPVADIAESTFTSEPTWGRITTGTYAVYGDFSGSVFYRLPASEEGFANSVIIVREIHDDHIVIVTGAINGDTFDGLLGNVTGRGTPFEIIVYP